ncbi:hypothetical protein [Spiroplasma floricola]|uniref:Uncharacterized protein n=1 Tax=Spiroplasma floricola 23-6 TaxID=1336749 RepID=A0A2K8SF64_9MOLU|nr:hypothetical protein [Spiroplasma floricola]AUB31480.1 hypothetical protein SFLOR_v1c04280 [Spiroplasma floricola 23-6]
MASKKAKNIYKNEVDDNVSLAMEDLLELAMLEFENKETSKDDNLKLRIEYEDDNEEFNPTDLNSIIKHARKIEQQNSQLKWVDPDQKIENDIISKAKNEGKSIYDAEVLRELILQRQKKKRETEGISSIISKVKK